MLGVQIARIWRGAVRREDGDAYASYMRTTGIAGYARTPGNRAALMLRRDVGDRCEFVMFTLWSSMEAVTAFAGPEPDKAVFYPDDDRYLIERALTAGTTRSTRPCWTRRSKPQDRHVDRRDLEDARVADLATAGPHKLEPGQHVVANVVRLVSSCAVLSARRACAPAKSGSFSCRQQRHEASSGWDGCDPRQQATPLLG